jgi:hypothetical protein
VNYTFAVWDARILGFGIDGLFKFTPGCGLRRR